MSNYPVEILQKIMNNTEFKTLERAKAVAETLLWLEAGAPHQFDSLPGTFMFDMSTFVEHDIPDFTPTKDDQPQNACGTACCIAGAIRMYERQGAHYESFEGDEDLDEVFDTDSKRELDTLFFAGMNGVHLHDVTPKGAAITLRRYIETGTVTWHKEEQK